MKLSAVMTPVVTLTPADWMPILKPPVAVTTPVTLIPKESTVTADPTIADDNVETPVTFNPKLPT